MTTSLTTTDTNPLLQTLRIFDAGSLGEGDVVAGTNVLAAMCISLANLHPPESCLTAPDGKRLRVGMSFATVSELTASLVNEKVLDPIARIQNNLCDHLASDVALADDRLAALAPQDRQRIRPKAPDRDTAMEKLTMGLNPVAASAHLDSSPYLALLSPLRRQDPSDLFATPAVFLNADSAAGLDKQLPLSHRHYPFIRAELREDRRAERLESMLLSVMRGNSLSAGCSGPVHVRGHVAACCTTARLARAVEAGEEGLLENLLWIADADGATLPVTESSVDAPMPLNTPANYAAALNWIWVRRLDCRQPEPCSIGYDWEPLQQKWISYLQELKSNFPGLTRAVRPLFGTLVYGMVRLSPRQSGGGARWTDSGALALAMFLVRLMIESRRRLAESARDVRILKLAAKLLPKLQAGPLDARSLVRKSSNLLINDCRDALDLCDLMKLVSCADDGKWNLLVPATQAVATLRARCVEV